MKATRDHTIPADAIPYQGVRPTTSFDVGKSVSRPPVSCIMTTSAGASLVGPDGRRIVVEGRRDLCPEG